MIAELFVLGFLVLRVAVQLFRYGAIAYTTKPNLRASLGHRHPVTVGKQPPRACPGKGVGVEGFRLPAQHAPGA